MRLREVRAKCLDRLFGLPLQWPASFGRSTIPAGYHWVKFDELSSILNVLCYWSMLRAVIVVVVVVTVYFSWH